MFVLLAFACTADPEKTDPGTTSGTIHEDSGTTTTTTGTTFEAWCAAEGFGPWVAWDAKGPYGRLRHDVADDFTVPLMDGTEWTLSEHWTGCETYIFVPDAITREDDDDRPVYSKDIDTLIEASPRNAHYFFVSVSRDDATAAENQDQAQSKVDSALADLATEDADWWREHLHVVSGKAGDLGGEVEAIIARGVGTQGYAIDRTQHIRGVGGFSDVTRSDAGASWPFKNNLAYAAHEARYFNMEAERDAALDPDATVIPVFTGEVISGYANMEVTLPSAEEMAGFDTFEVDIDMRCPDPDQIEYGNCGAWDYIAGIYVQAEDESWIELGRFITTYHREAHWVQDLTPMMVHLLAGGTRTIQWSWAPYWNVQPTETRVSLRFSNQGKGMAPRTFTLLETGGSFGSTYNDGREPKAIEVPPTAKKVELWSVISGHGAGTHQCAEFCNHQHEFTVNGNVHLQEYPMASTAEGCIQDIEGQMTPNQNGTWWYGRGGWCPGGVVHPYAVDVTGEVTAGSTAEFAYRGLYDGVTPEDGSGDIVMNGWVVTYE